jgi:hypothetical protein
VGHFAIQFAKAAGARVLTTVSTNNVKFARELGADVAIDYRRNVSRITHGTWTWCLISSMAKAGSARGAFEGWRAEDGTRSIRDRACGKTVGRAARRECEFGILDKRGGLRISGCGRFVAIREGHEVNISVPGEAQTKS